MRLALLTVVPLIGACGPRGESGADASGVFTRAAFHLMVECDGADYARKTTYVYPTNTEASTYVIEDHAGDLVVRYGDVEIGSGTRDGRDVTIDLTHVDDDPGAAVEWRLRAHVEESLPFHAKAIVGSLDAADAPTEGEGCAFGGRNLVWLAAEPDVETFGRSTIAGDAPGPVLGEYDLFAWWVRLGSVSPDPQKGVDRATIAGDLVSLALSTNPTIEMDALGAVQANDGVTAPGTGVADATGLWFEQVDHSIIDVSVSQAVFVNENRAEGGEAAVQRVIVGFVDGSLNIDADFYPPGVTGPSGWLKIDRPGLAFWEDVDYGPNGEPGSFAPVALSRIVETNGRVRIVDGVVQ